MTQRPLATANVAVADSEIASVLWAACPELCNAAGDEAVGVITRAIAQGAAAELEIQGQRARDAAVELVACAGFVQTAATAHAIFVLRERRAPSTHELVFEAARLDGPVVTQSYALARCFVAQRPVC